VRANVVMIKISGKYLIFVNPGQEAQVVKKINEFEESLSFFFTTNSEEECYQMYDELFRFIAENGTFLKLRGLKVADVVLPPKDVTFEELKELWHIRRRNRNKENGEQLRKR